MIDITTIPDDELKRDLEDSQYDISVCELALSRGITTYSQGSVAERLEKNKGFVRVIMAELERRTMGREVNSGQSLRVCTARGTLLH